MPERLTNRLSETWLQAAVVGSLWASFEIIIGSFLHNLRVPFAGTILSFASVGLIIAFIQVWKNKGLVWKAGLIAALLKSISPSAIILGPMIGIFTEALIIELFLVILGRNFVAYLAGGAFAVLSSLLHKVVSLLITYGFDLLVIVEQLYLYIIRQLGITSADPVILIIAVMLVYMLVGMFGSILGYMGGRKALHAGKSEGGDIIPDHSSSFFDRSVKKRFSPWFLLYHLLCIIACLYMINRLPIWFSLFPSLAYAIYCLYAYRSSMRSFRKPSFWIWFMAITILAAIFWNGLSKGNLWDTEGLLVGLRMNLRAVVILTGFAAISRELRNPIIRTVLYHHGFASVYHAVGLAFSVLPGVIDSLPGVKKMIKKPVNGLGDIVKRATEIYPVLKAELTRQTPVIIITGEIQQGKTSYLMNLIPLLQSKELSLAGFVARGVHKGDHRIGYDLVDLNTEERVEYLRESKIPNGFRHGKYFFSKEGLAFGNNILRSAEDNDPDIIVIDEIGPVELKGKGWANKIEHLVNTSSVPQLWVVRKPILQKVIRQWNIGKVLIIDIGSENTEDSAAEIRTFIQ